jgi:hypothetical protein
MHGEVLIMSNSGKTVAPVCCALDSGIVEHNNEQYTFSINSVTSLNRHEPPESNGCTAIDQFTGCSGKGNIIRLFNFIGEPNFSEFSDPHEGTIDGGYLSRESCQISRDCPPVSVALLVVWAPRTARNRLREHGRKTSS